MRIKATTTAHIQTHEDIFIIGTKTIITALRKITSAILSSFAPKALSFFILLATNPSNISLIPHNKYNIQNNNEKGFENDIKKAHTIRIIVIIFGKLFIKSLL